MEEIFFFCIVSVSFCGDFFFVAVCNGVQREHYKIEQWTANLTQRYRPNETTGGIFVAWQERRNYPTGA